MVICLERGADLHMAQLMPLPLTISCFSKIQIGFTFLVPAHLGSPGKRAVKRVCVCVCSTYYASSANNIHVVCSVVCVSACQLDNNSEPCKNGLNLSRQQHLQNALFDALRQLSGTHYRKLFSVVTLLHFLSLHVDKRHSSFRRLSLLSLLTNTLPGPSASKVTTLWCYTNLFIIIIIK